MLCSCQWWVKRRYGEHSLPHYFETNETVKLWQIDAPKHILQIRYCSVLSYHNCLYVSSVRNVVIGFRSSCSWYHISHRNVPNWLVIIDFPPTCSFFSYCCVKKQKLVKILRHAVVEHSFFFWNKVPCVQNSLFSWGDEISAGRMVVGEEERWKTLEWRKSTCALKMRDGLVLQTLVSATLHCNSTSTIFWNTARGRTENLTARSRKHFVWIEHY